MRVEDLGLREIESFSNLKIWSLVNVDISAGVVIVNSFFQFAERSIIYFSSSDSFLAFTFNICLIYLIFNMKVKIFNHSKIELI